MFVAHVADPEMVRYVVAFEIGLALGVLIGRLRAPGFSFVLLLFGLLPELLGDLGHVGREVFDTGDGTLW